LNNFVLVLLTSFALFGAVGMLIGQRKGRAGAGLFFGMLLGPIGWLVVALGPSRQDLMSVACPHCGGRLPIEQEQCEHCGNRVTWLRRRAFKPSRAA